MIKFLLVLWWRMKQHKMDLWQFMTFTNLESDNRTRLSGISNHQKRKEWYKCLYLISFLSPCKGRDITQDSVPATPQEQTWEYSAGEKEAMNHKQIWSWGNGERERCSGTLPHECPYPTSQEQPLLHSLQCQLKGTLSRTAETCPLNASVT